MGGGGMLCILISSTGERSGNNKPRHPAHLHLPAARFNDSHAGAHTLTHTQNQLTIRFNDNSYAFISNNVMLIYEKCMMVNRLKVQRCAN